MGHTRLGEIPKSNKWNRVVEQVVGRSLAGDLADPFNITKIAAITLDAAEQGLRRAARDPGVRYTFYLITQIALASRKTNWESALEGHGIKVSPDSSIFDFTVQIQNAIDRHIREHSHGATDLSEIAQQAVGEAFAGLADAEPGNLFGGTDVKNAVRSVSTKKGFGRLGQKFFGMFTARFLNFYLSRITASSLGKRQIESVGNVMRFNQALSVHCEESARIVRDFCGAWYSKTEHERGIDRENTNAFLGVAIRKLRDELRLQGMRS